MKTEASHFFSGAYFDNQYYDQKPQLDINNNNNQFTIDELLDFSNEDESLTDGFFGNSADSSTLTDLDTYNYNTSQTQFSGDFSCTHAQFSTNQLCVPDDELAELEWLSNFVEESFSTDDLQNFHLISATKAPTDSSSSEFRPQTMPTSTHAPPLFHTSVSVPGKARSKRSRAAPCDWSSRLLVLKKTEIETKEKGPTRKCLHCGSDKTPQWRSGPMGPKTLCNACGVRFKSGRLVPEYRPAASPTFVSAKHSNSHRKVMELRRQKELQVAHQQQLLSQTPIFGVSNGQDYLIHPPCGPTFRHMI